MSEYRGGSQHPAVAWLQIGYEEACDYADPEFLPSQLNESRRAPQPGDQSKASYRPEPSEGYSGRGPRKINTRGHV